MNPSFLDASLTGAGAENLVAEMLGAGTSGRNLGREMRAASTIVTISAMTNRTGYTEDHAKSGLDHRFPDIDTWPNQFPAYEIVIDVPEFTSVCPKTGLPDFGVIEIRYVPDQLCLELKSLKEYLTEYRNLCIFQENIVNQVREDVVRAARPRSATIRGVFRPRGGIGTTVEATWPRP